MNLIRTVVSAFIVLLLASVAAGWRWTAAHQTAAQSAASHVVLALSALAGVCGLVVIWTWRRDHV